MKQRWEEMSVHELEAEVRRHNQLYFEQHAPEISDVAFDQLVELLRERRPDSPVLSELVSDVRPAGVKVRHDVPMLSLEKCYDEETAKSWASKFEGEVIASPKIDGVAVSLRYDRSGALTRGATRGNGIEGEEITANVHQVSAIPQRLKAMPELAADEGVEVRGEIFMPLSVFQRYREQFANPRNLAAGAIKQKDPQKTAAYELSFFAYDLLGAQASTEVEKYRILHEAGFAQMEWRKVSRDALQEAYEHFLANRENYDFETDGVVLKANLVAEQGRLGATAHHPRYALAYKFQGDSGVTTLLDIEWSVARTGAITPIAIVEPVELSGAQVRRASLHNVGILKRLGVAKGARVLMMRRGGVIPNLESVVEPGGDAFPIPEQCPSCGAPTRLEDDFLICTEPATCVRSKIGELEHFVKTVGIDGFGEKLLEQLYAHGVVTDAAEFYELTLDELLRMERMGETLATKLLGNVEAHRRIPLATFLQSLGMREVGRHAAKILAGFGSMERLAQLTEEELAEIHTIGEVIAHEVVEGLKQKRPLIEKLLKQVEVEGGEPPKQQGPLQGKTVLFTGKLLSMERSEAQRLVEEAGGEAAQSVTKALDLLVVGDGGGAGSKLAKAQKLQAEGGKLQIMGEKAFLKKIGRDT